ncbi:hypothetical protein EIP91_009167 [Steccherinum ochraceum]|uniref:Uncharacterized protein n=1 Tax=Steccherinum ochraceum TaxID=92696 RepID=A0A4V2MV47_9APHY|nr:hypothetical protein EIP91_009167 [Steccherinum ochraceum]
MNSQKHGELDQAKGSLLELQCKIDAEEAKRSTSLAKVAYSSAEEERLKSVLKTTENALQAEKDAWEFWCEEVDSMLSEVEAAAQEDEPSGSGTSQPHRLDSIRISKQATT